MVGIFISQMFSSASHLTVPVGPEERQQLNYYFYYYLLNAKNEQLTDI